MDANLLDDDLAQIQNLEMQDQQPQQQPQQQVQTAMLVTQSASLLKVFVPSGLTFRFGDLLAYFSLVRIINCFKIFSLFCANFDLHYRCSFGKLEFRLFFAFEGLVVGPRCHTFSPSVVECSPVVRSSKTHGICFYAGDEVQNIIN